jgi:kynurenine formamidase
LVATGVDRLWGKPEYFSQAPGMGREATDWLLAQGIKVIGIDTYGFDRPFPVMLREFWKTGDSGHLWPAHFLGREKEYIQIERLTNLDKLPDKGFRLACFPLKIKGLDASWVRAVAIIEH